MGVALLIKPGAPDPIQSIDENQVLRSAYVEGDQAIDGFVFGIGQPHTLVRHVQKNVANCVWERDRQSLYALVHQVDFGPNAMVQSQKPAPPLRMIRSS